LTEEYVDYASGFKNDRERYRAMLEAARKRRFDVLLVWRYDRFARSMQELVNALAEFEGLGIDFISYNEGQTRRPRRAGCCSGSWLRWRSSSAR
jgi:DNA invertase Pin-like site-specific DNA recombinase